jgi:hypothetical protein
VRIKKVQRLVAVVVAVHNKRCRMSTYIPPQFRARAFHCAICRVYASQSWNSIRASVGGSGFETPYEVSYCHHCHESSYWEDERLARPSTATVEPHHIDLPIDCVVDYDEARDISARSPKGASALLRLCIQKLMVHLGESGKNLNEDIASLVAKGLPIQVQQAMDFCRVIGNNAVHPGEIQLDDTPELADQLFSMINFIVEDRITRPKQIETLFGKLPAGAIKAIEKRDAIIPLLPNPSSAK